MKLNHGLISQRWSSQDILVNKTFLLSASESTKHGFSSWWDIFNLQFWGGKNVCARLIPNFTSTKISKSKQRIRNRKQQEILPIFSLLTKYTEGRVIPCLLGALLVWPHRGQRCETQQASNWHRAQCDSNYVEYPTISFPRHWKA